MSDREHASRVGPEASGGDALGAAGKRSRVVQRWAAGRGAGPVGLAPDGAAAAQGGGEVGDATAGDDPFGLHLGAAAADGPADDGAPIRAAAGHPVAVQRAADPTATPEAEGREAAGGLIVEDGQAATAGQLTRSAFLALLRREVIATATEALGPMWSAAGCPYIERWFARHADSDAATLDRLARRYAGGAARTANDYIAPICARLRASIARWRGGGDIAGELAAAGLSAAEVADAAGPRVLRKADGAGDGERSDGGAVLARLGGGSALPADTAARMEGAFGDRFDDVRVHTDAGAQAEARRQGALAFTVGNHVAFGAGQYQPGTPEGDALMAHELAHVQQQRGGGAAVAAKGAEASDEPAAEADADQAAEGVLRRLYGGVTSTIGRVGAAMSTGLSLKRCRDPERETRGPETAGGEAGRDGGATDGGTVDAGPPPITETSVTTELTAGGFDPTVVLEHLRQLTPVGVGATPTALDTAIDAHLTGDALWRAHNIRIYGPEANWPPILRGDTALMLGTIRGRLMAGTMPTEAEVADALRPLNRTAQHQAITAWRREIPTVRFGGGAQRTAFFDRVMQLLDGPSYAPVDDLGAVPPILDLETRTEAELYAYFQRVCSARGFTFQETDLSVPISSANPIKFMAFNIREYERTTTAHAASARTAVTGRTDFTGRMFLLWRDGTAPGVQHAPNWEWSNTGIGATKLGDTRAHGDEQLSAEAGFGGFNSDSRGAVSRTDRRAITAATDADTVARDAQQHAADATTSAATAATQATTAETSSANRAVATVATTGTQALATTALTTALAARQAAARAILEADRAIRLLGSGTVSAGIQAPADSKTAAEAAKTSARDSYARARGAWIIARQQHLASEEERLRREWERVEADPASTADQKRDARRAYDAARTRNNSGSGESNTGDMSENNALPWLHEGQYVANLRSGDKGGYAFWSVDAGISANGNGMAPVDRDWDADGRIDPGERDVPGTAVGTGVLIHRGDATTHSIGCQVAPEDAYGEFVAALSTGRSSPARTYAYVVVEARHLPPWAAGAAGATGAVGGAAVGGGGDAGAHE